MNLGLAASIKLAEILGKGFSEQSWWQRLVTRESFLKVVVAPSCTALLEVGAILQESTIAVAAQNVFWQEKGAYTGEISPLMLLEIGCQYAIIGHSERRQFLGETDTMVNQKVKATLAVGLIPILCVGETLEERQKGQYEYVVMQQLSKAIAGVSLKSDDRILIAYEPVWAIGTNRPVAPDDVKTMNLAMKHVLYEFLTNEEVQKQCRFLYGGSVTPENVASFTSNDFINGVLVGGASLRSKDFLSIIESVKNTAYAV